MRDLEDPELALIGVGSGVVLGFLLSGEWLHAVLAAVAFFFSFLLRNEEEES